MTIMREGRDIIMAHIYAAAAFVILIPVLLLLNKRYINILIEQRIADYQNDLVKKHCDEVENIYRQMRGWRHDYHNHIQVMSACLAENRQNELRTYLVELNSDLVKVDTVLKTGNIMLDAILNSKISLAKSKDITVNAKALVPKNLNVNQVDLCIIIGNLLDNSIEACLKNPNSESRFIRIYVGIHKELLYISVSNSMGEKALRHGNKYFSTKESDSHGFGLVRIDKIAQKYSGFVNRQTEDGVFATEVMLPY